MAYVILKQLFSFVKSEVLANKLIIMCTVLVAGRQYYILLLSIVQVFKKTVCAVQNKRHGLAQDGNSVVFSN